MGWVASFRGGKMGHGTSHHLGPWDIMSMELFVEAMGFGGEGGQVDGYVALEGHDEIRFRSADDTAM